MLVLISRLRQSWGISRSKHSFLPLLAPSYTTKRWLRNPFLLDPIFIRFFFQLLQQPHDYLCILFLYQYGFRSKRNLTCSLVYFPLLLKKFESNCCRLSDASRKHINLLDSEFYPTDITYFTFCSNVSTTTVDCRALNTSLTLEFYIRLPQSLCIYYPTTTVISSPFKYPLNW